MKPTSPSEQPYLLQLWQYNLSSCTRLRKGMEEETIRIRGSNIDIKTMRERERAALNTHCYSYVSSFLLHQQNKLCITLNVLNLIRRDCLASNSQIRPRTSVSFSGDASVAMSSPKSLVNWTSFNSSIEMNPRLALTPMLVESRELWWHFCFHTNDGRRYYKSTFGKWDIKLIAGRWLEPTYLLLADWGQKS